MEKERNFNLDLIRAIGSFCVVAFHALVFTGFFSLPSIRFAHYPLFVWRNIFSICCPLFMLLSGYLLSKKEPNEKYFQKLIKILVAYLVFFVFYLIYGVLFLKNSLTFSFILSCFFGIESAGYAWYLEMYAGLFVFAPFINVAYNSLKEKRHKQLLILGILTFTALPSAIYLINLISFEYLISPPNFWLNLYPISYYLIGAYIREYKPKLPFKQPALIFGLLVVVSAYISLLLSLGYEFKHTVFDQWGSFWLVLISVTAFIGVLGIKTENWPMWIKKIVTKISNVSMSLFLVSAIVDNILYSYILHILPQDISKFWAIPTFLASFVLSFIAAIVFEEIVEKGVKVIVKKKKTE